MRKSNFKSLFIFLTKNLIIIFTLFMLGVSTFTNITNVYDGKVVDYVNKHKSNPVSYIHTEIRNDGVELDSFNATSKKYTDKIVTDFLSYSSYMTIETDSKNTFELNNDILSHKIDTKIMYFGRRFDLNRKFLEAIRLRQYRTNVDSRSIAQGYNFSFYMSSIQADEIIKTSDGIFSNYDSILDYNNGIGLSIQGDFGNGVVKGHVRNIYFIEEDNKISLELYHYLKDFIIIYGNVDALFGKHQKVFNYDFLCTFNSIKNNLKFLDEINFGHLNFLNSSGDGIDTTLTNIMMTDSRHLFDWVFVIILIVIIVSILCLVLLFNKQKKPIFSKKILNYCLMLFMNIFLTTLILKILSTLEFSSLFAVTILNPTFGVYILFLLLLCLTYISCYLYRLKVTKKGINPL